MKEVIYTVESDRVEQRPAIIAASVYCLAIVITNLIRHVPNVLIGMILLAVGVGYCVSAYRGKDKQFLYTIGALMIVTVIMAGIDNLSISQIPVRVIGHFIGHFCVMAVLGVFVFKRREEYYRIFDINVGSVCAVLSFVMALIYLFFFFGVCTAAGYYHFSDLFVPIGDTILYIYQISLVEFMYMTIVILSMVLQKPVIIEYYYDNDALDE